MYSYLQLNKIHFFSFYHIGLSNNSVHLFDCTVTFEGYIENTQYKFIWNEPKSSQLNQPFPAAFISIRVIDDRVYQEKTPIEHAMFTHHIYSFPLLYIFTHSNHPIINTRQKHLTAKRIDKKKRETLAQTLSYMVINIYIYYISKCIIYVRNGLYRQFVAEKFDFHYTCAPHRPIFTYICIMPSIFM